MVRSHPGSPRSQTLVTWGARLSQYSPAAMFAGRGLVHAVKLGSEHHNGAIEGGPDQILKMRVLADW